MDLEENSDVESMEGDFEEEDDNDIENASFTEVCVICTGLITERGIIDSCDHWFCYECIEQWAEFANHCPTCKLIFTSISPVDESNDSFEGDESSLSIDDDSLYFPTNFINEENVKCLEGEKCKLRNGLIEFGEFTTDTSVACDSCENWYHAICVNFDLNFEYEGGWICPRCLSIDQNSEIQSINSTSSLAFNATSSAAFNANISVSIDDGETAVVVSFHKDPSKNEILQKENNESEKENLSDFMNLSPIREVELIDEKEIVDKSDDISTEIEEHKEETLITENSDTNIIQKPIIGESSNHRVTKRQNTESMLEPIPVSKKSKTLKNPSIMSIITEKPSSKKETNSGVRTKKIIQKPSIIQELQTEIKTLKNKTSVNDEKLLDAFRAVINPNKSNSRAKPSFCNKGNRKNLMKKIYSNSNGRRRAFWERDCEVEFWKNKCESKINKEKVETLQNILELLKNGPKKLENVKEGQNRDKKDEILSRVYLADSSVFPRKDEGLKPLSLIGEKNIEEINKLEKCDKIENMNISSSNLNEKKKEEKLICGIKSDKKKWALEILARKSSLSLEKNEEKNEDLSSLKTNYPLLAQLPLDMKPELAPSQRNKIPVPVRQAQLYRLTEHFLRRANIGIIKRRAETELAVADAINIEKEICDKSNSKVVYLNLISQSLRQFKLNQEKIKNNDREIEEKSDKITEKSIQMSEKCEEIREQNSEKMMEISTDEMSEKSNKINTVEELLKLAGLDSDEDICQNDENTLGVNKEGMIGENDQNALLERESDVEKALKMAGFCSDDSGEIRVERKMVLERESSIESKRNLVLEREISPESKKKEPGISGNNNKPVLEREISPESKNKEQVLERESRPENKNKDSVLERDKNNPCENSNHSESSKNIITNKNKNSNNRKKEEREKCESENESCAESRSHIKTLKPVNQKLTNSSISISKKVEAYIKEHLRPLCKSEVINVSQYRWAVSKTTEKVMRFHHKDQNANFLIKEGEKVKKLADQYVEQAAKEKGL